LQRWAVSDPLPPGITEQAASEFSQPASMDRMRRVARSLDDNGIRTRCADTGAEARQIVASLLPDGAEVFNNTSRTLEVTGVADDIERSGRYEPLRLRLFQMDREMQANEMRILAASPDYVVGSAHAVTDGGSLLIASASGSQLGPIASGAGHVILIVGSQKIVPDVQTGMRRIYDYSLPLEDRRARQAYGVPSGVNNVLIINHAVSAERLSVILVHEALGF
jgi:LUD domain